MNPHLENPFARAAAARRDVRELSPQEAVATAHAGALLLDVREPEQFAAGHIRGAYNLRLAELEAGRGALPEDPSVPIICYCDAGQHGAHAAGLLASRGFHRVASLAGGLRAFRSALGEDD